MAIFTGHLQHDRVFRYGKILYVNTPPLIFGSINISPRTFRLVSFQDGKLRLDDIFPEVGKHETWVQNIVRPAAADSPRPQPHESWPMFQHDAARTGQTADVVKPPLELAWRRTLPGTIHLSSPVVADGRVYVSLTDEEDRGTAGVYALDAATGKDLWHFASTSSVRSTVSAAYGLVYGANEEGNFFALDAATGNRKWHYSLGDPLDCFVFNSPVVYEHAVYGGLVEHFVGLDALAGKPIWERKKMPAGQEELMSPPAAGNGLIFVGFDWKNGMFALSAKTGQTKWQNNKGLATYRASPSLVGQTIYSDGNDGELHVLDWQNGREEWKSPTGSGSFSSPSSPAIRY